MLLLDTRDMTNRVQKGPTAWFVIRNVFGGGALAVAFGLALALACLAVGLLLRGGLELVAWALRGLT